MRKHKVLSTKKLEPSLTKQAGKNGIEIIEQEAIKVNPILSKHNRQKIFQLIESKKEFVVFTSSNAVLAVKKYLHNSINSAEVKWKIFSLSGKTKEVLDENAKTFGTIMGIADHSKELAKKIVNEKIDEIFFFCGNKRRDELPNILKEAGVKVHEIMVYETVGTPVAASENFDAILFFSPSAVQSFFSVNQLKKDVVCFAIGQTTASSIANFTGNKIIVSESPNQKTMLSSVQFYFENSNCKE